MFKRKLATLLAVTTLAVMSFAACGDSASTTTAPETTEEAAVEEETVEVETEESAATSGDDAGFEENPIFEDEEVGFMNVSAVYFQAVPMENETTSYDAADADIHIEADISALENDLGYGVGDWVPYLTVDYLIEDASSGDEVVSGTFMEMAASDGPHYGANIKLDPGSYNLTITIHSPGENGYLIHSDSETGPGGALVDYFGDGPLSTTFEGWDFAGLE